MDSGSLQSGEDLMETFDTTALRLPEEIVWIMDQILALQVRSSVAEDASTNNSGGLAQRVSIVADALHVSSHRPSVVAGPAAPGRSRL